VSEAFTWWAVMALLGAIGLPFALLAFRALPDRGYNFSKLIGLLLASYVVWLGGSLGVLPGRQWSIMAVVALLALVSLAIAARRRDELREFVSRRWPYILASEALFAAAFALALLLRADVVDVLPGERPTDMALLTSLVRADHYPPPDPRLSGHDINYYYFGHLMLANLAEMTAVPARISFNLGIALIAALSVSAAFGLVFNLVVPRAKTALAVAVALLGPFLLLVVSNAVGLFELMAVHGIGSSGFYEAVDIAGLDGSRESEAWYPTEWLWPGRSISFVNGNVDQQFPFAKFLLGELHSENVAIPLVLLLVGCALAVWRTGYQPPRLSAAAFALYAFPALALGALLTAQSWYMPALLALLVLAFAARLYVNEGRLTLSFARRTALFAAAALALPILLFLPFFGASFSAFGGLDLADDAAATQPHHLLYMWLPLGTLAVALALIGLRESRPTRAAIIAAAALPAAIVAVWAAWALLDGRLGDAMIDRLENGGWLTALALAAALVATTIALLDRASRAGDSAADDPLTPALALSALALILLLGVQFFWVDDNSRPGFNTLIKANFLAWFFLSLSGALALYHLLRDAARRRPDFAPGRAALAAVALIALAVGLVYPLTATLYATRLFGEERHLDLLWQIEQREPDEYRALLWLDENVDGTPTVLEATGGVSYTDYGRVSAFTGLPTVLGWPPHEFHWRGSWAPQEGRQDDVALIYGTASAEEATSLMARYHVEYVYVGRLERQAYGEAGLAKFAAFMDIAFRSGDVTVYRLPPP
jgi:YYY domain-containing protein